MRPRAQWLPARIVLLTLLAALGLISAACSPFTDPTAREVVFTVPEGSVARLAAGEDVQILPPTIELTLGEKDVLIIRNDDTEPITVGPFKIEPGQRFRQQYHNAGTFDLMCTLHESERLRVVVKRPGEA
jgi:hypothetical protein